MKKQPMLNTKIIRAFLFSAGALLLITALAKLISASGGVHILKTSDPVLYLSFRHVFRVVGSIELVVALVCFFGKRPGLQTALVAWLATSFLLYRVGLLLVGYHKPCSCAGLGNLTDALHISPQTADTAMKTILAYLLIGSYATLFWLWRQRKKPNSSSLPA
jgi:hypothetical protein